MPSGPKRRRAAKNKTNELIVPKVEPVDEQNALEYSMKIEKGLAVKTEPVPVELVESPGPVVSLVETLAESFTEVGLVEQVVESPGVDLVEPVVESAVVGLVDSVTESPAAVVGLDHEPVVYELVNSSGVVDATIAEENGSVQKNSSDGSVELGDVKKTIEEQTRIVEQVAVNLRKILANFH